MRKVILILAFISGISIGVHGQSALNKVNPEEKVKQLKDKLGLTDAQVTKIKAIYTQQNVKMDSLKKVGADNTKVQEVTKSSDDKIKAVLTPIQAAAYNKMSDMKNSKMIKSIGF
jgi:Spy/CpxP family protein refolding chaperone